MRNIYLEILTANKAKLVNLFNRDEMSVTKGYGDRLHWGWKVSDFSNGTMQGGVHAMAHMLNLGVFEGEEDKVLELISSSILAIEKIAKKNGSMEEAYPRENSFCVTALVAFDALWAIDLLGEKLAPSIKRNALEVLKPLVKFITQNGEEHAIISNHLATGVAAIFKWNKLTGAESNRGIELLDIIYKHQSEEGWYKEYEGADPGYQTLCTYYLACAYEDSKDERLLNSLQSSGEFLKYFVHPDGTIGGNYGSRNTEVFYPGGVVILSKYLEVFNSIRTALEEGITNNKNLLPQNIDVGNYIPFLNSYAVAASHRINLQDVPLKLDSEERDFKETGIFVKTTERYHTILNYKKGGVCKVFDKSLNRIDFVDSAYFGVLSNGKKISSQVMNDGVDFSERTISTQFYYINESNPSSFTTLVLRFLSMTIFRSVYLGNIFKKRIVGMLMTGKKKAGGSVTRSYVFSDSEIIIEDKVERPNRTETVERKKFAKAIHMASSGYFINQHWELPEESTIVKLK